MDTGERIVKGKEQENISIQICISPPQRPKGAKDKVTARVQGPKAK